MASKLFDIAGKVAVVTGGGRGIGAMIANTLVESGVKVYITSRNADACHAAAEEMSAKGPGTCHALPHDLSREKGILAFAEELADKEPKLDILVNNSGATWGEPFRSYPEEAWDRVFALNVTSVFNLSRACLPLLKAGASAEDPSRIINIGSIVGLVPQPVPTYAYDTSKAAVHHLTKKLSVEFAPKKITVNAIAPGFVPSKMSSQLLTYASREAIERAIPLARWGSAEDMGGTVVYLASRAGAWTTGAIIPVDGGAVAKPLDMVADE